MHRPEPNDGAAATTGPRRPRPIDRRRRDLFRGPNFRRPGRACVPFFALVAAWLPAAAREVAAHNPDTSYARLAIERDRTTTTLTFDVTSLVRLAPSLDADADHRLTPAELTAAMPRIVDALRRSISFEVDAAATDLGDLQTVAWPPDAGAFIAEKDYHAPTSLVALPFVKRLSRPPAAVWIRFDWFRMLGERHTVLGAIAHEGRDEEVLFTPFEPDYFYETKYVAEPTNSASSPTRRIVVDLPTAESSAGGDEAEPRRRSADETVWSRLRLFFRFGVEHILIGYDHLLFLAALVVVSPWRDLVKIVTSFTVAHSLTLALATLGWVDLPSNLVEAAIAATIVYTALENFRIDDAAGRWKLTFLFGLIHGFGFAGVLRELALPSDGFVRALLAFNLGVEAGQLSVVAVAAVPAALLARSRFGLTGRKIASAAIAVCGACWFLDRTLGTELMPF